MSSFASKYPAVRLAAALTLSTSLAVSTAFPAGAEPRNPSDTEIAQATTEAGQAEGRVSALVSSVSESDAEISQLEMEMGGLRESVNKALVDYHDAETSAEQAREGVKRARAKLDQTQSEIEEAQKVLDEISRSEYRRQGGNNRGVSELAGAETSEDALDRQTFKRVNAEKQRETVEKLDKLRTEQANEESRLREARNIAEDREKIAKEKKDEAESRIEDTSKQLDENIRKRAELVAERDRAQRELDKARGTVSALESDRKEYQDYIKAEEERKKAEEAAKAAEAVKQKALEEQRAKEEAARKAKREAEAAQKAQAEAEAKKAADEKAEAEKKAAAAKKAEAQKRLEAAEKAAEAAKAKVEQEAEKADEAKQAQDASEDKSTEAAAALIEASQPDHTSLEGNGGGNAIQNPEGTQASGNEAVDSVQVETNESVSEQASETVSDGSRSSQIETVISRAMSQLGVPYAWGGGNANGPTRGIRDGGVADSYGDYNKVGFDCSGLVVYAFAGVGIALPHYTGYQYQRGTKVAPANMQRGDLIFYGPNAEQHVAIYLGDGQMIEAPQSGSTVQISPVRWSGMSPYVVRMI
ncbi:cell wall-associated hydrolase [Corynebacterium pelargi]|uniref:Peptidoglycan endopeptidase RipA n=1 Tax=Corynebacterium pelargi TaxID=1471400 RepID=A0A410W8T2_9CORY|nr:Peptidoglycan endopeptidase RipA precursor [Corynebacterium pelargi]GGG68255.1 cell wall-associated hydrolase [Corynebacterium pelargi]